MMMLVITSPTVKPMTAPLPTPVSCVSAATLEAVVPSVRISCVAGDGLSEDATGDEGSADDVAVVVVADGDDNDDGSGNGEADAAVGDDGGVTELLALSSRARYQLVLQKPPPLCSSTVPWALTILKTNGFVRFVSSA